MKDFLFLKSPRIFKRLKKSTPEMEQDFRDRLEQEQVSFTDKLLMIGTAFFVLALPSILILLGIAFFSMWVFGAF